MTEDEITAHAQNSADGSHAITLMLSGMTREDAVAVVKKADYLKRAKIWKYSPTTGELLGADIADPDPLTEGEFLLPAFSTRIAPGSPHVGRAWRFNEYSVWENVADCRGEVWWKADAKDNTDPMKIVNIGDPTHWGLTNVEPPAPPVASVSIAATVSPRQIRLALTQMGCRTPFEARVTAGDQSVIDTWQFASKFERNGLVNDVLSAMGKTPAEIDALFEVAKTL